AISGAAYTLLGAAYLLDTAVQDIAALYGVEWQRHVSHEAALAAMLLGALNAASGLQPKLLARPSEDLPKVLGFGENGNLKSGGFLNASVFYFILTYQGLRALPSFPTFLVMDTVVGAVSIAAVLHQAFLLNAWVTKGSMHRVDALLVPAMFNLPVSVHLLLQGEVEASGPPAPEAMAMMLSRRLFSLPAIKDFAQYEAMKTAKTSMMVGFYTGHFSAAGKMYRDQFEAMSKAYPKASFYTCDVDDAPLAAYDSEVTEVPSIVRFP
ncbi:unnamed protein product, partial [Polarella glacialis]